MVMPKTSVTTEIASASDPNQDYLTRAELSAYLAKGSVMLVRVLSRDDADAPIRRVLTAAGQTTPNTTPVLDALDDVVSGIVDGRDITEAYPRIARLIHAQDARAEVVNQLLVTQDYSRLARAMRVRHHLEESILAQAMNDELLPAERVILLEALEQMITTSRKHVAGQSTSVNDVASLLEKLDYTTELAGEALKKKFAKTSVQGREVVRKLLLRVTKAVKEATPETT